MQQQLRLRQRHLNIYLPTFTWWQKMRTHTQAVIASVHEVAYCAWSLHNQLLKPAARIYPMWSFAPNSSASSLSSNPNVCRFTYSHPLTEKNSNWKPINYHIVVLLPMSDDACSRKSYRWPFGVTSVCGMLNSSLVSHCFRIIYKKRFGR